MLLLLLIVRTAVRLKDEMGSASDVTRSGLWKACDLAPGARRVRASDMPRWKMFGVRSGLSASATGQDNQHRAGRDAQQSRMFSLRRRRAPYRIARSGPWRLTRWTG
jgi:hypothetical protein